MDNLLLFFLVVKCSLACVFLGYASSSDIRRRLVSNRVWLYFAPLAAVVAILEAAVLGYSMFWLLAGFIIPALFALGVYFLGGFGGADFKCLVCLGLLFPFVPGFEVVGFVFFVFTVGAFLCVFVEGSCNLIRNFVSWRRDGFLFSYPTPWYIRLRVVFDCCKVKLSYVDGLFYLPMQNVDGSFNFKKSDLIVTLKINRLKERFPNEDTKIWVYDAPALIPYFTLGFLFTFFVFLAFAL
jgi:Flp pilus assembly protein protease CpaA